MVRVVASKRSAALTANSMARVLSPRQQRWYDELTAVSYYGEADLEREIRQHINSLFPHHHVFPFKKDVASAVDQIKKKPDLGMIRRDFSAWGIIEVELARHSIEHVLEQTRVYARGSYNAPEMAEYIRSQLHKHCGRSASVARLTKLISSELPAILVIADAYAEGWQEKLKRENVDICIFEIYKSTRGDHVYRTKGDYPAVPVQEAHCRRDPLLANVLEVVGGFEFKRLQKNNRVVVSIDECLTPWTLFTNNRKRYLRFLGKINPLVPNVEYSLIGDKSHRYRFERS